MISTDFNKLKRLAYEYESLGLPERQGEAILNFLKMPPGATVRIRELIGAEQMGKIQDKLAEQVIEMPNLKCLKEFVDYASSDEYVRLAGLIEVILPCTTPEIFTMRKTYTVVETVDDNRGKWPNSLGNGWFTDSRYIIEDLIDMIVESAPQ